MMLSPEEPSAVDDFHFKYRMPMRAGVRAIEDGLTGLAPRDGGSSDVVAGRAYLRLRWDPAA
jgi:hypothetical protein